MAFFDYLPDWPRDPNGLAGTLAWTGTHFGIPDIDRRGIGAVAEAICSEDRESFLRIFQPAIDTARGGEFRIVLTDNRVIFVHCDANIEQAPDGRPLRIFGTLHDVTDRQQFEERLSGTTREREMLLAVIDACPISVTVADARLPNMPLIYANRTFQELTGYGRDEKLGMNCRFLQGPETDPAAIRMLSKAVRSGSPVDVRLVNYRKDGAPFLNHVVLAPIRDEAGRLTAYIGLQTDVTAEAKREEADRQRQRIEALGRMMGGVAHEINNLLQPVTLMTEELLALHPDGETHAYLDVILNCALGARSIIGDLLAFSRPERREARVVGVASLLRDALLLVRKALGPGIVIECEPGDHDMPIRVDRTAFTQVLLNLSANAAAAMDGSGTVRLTLETLSDYATDQADAPARAGRCVRIAVADTGCGMDSIVLERAFEPFFTTKPVGQGTGLGLSVAYGLVREMGGEISLRSAPGRGTTVSVLLPEAQGDR
ncbi:ATP-binding protein [Paracraurococcus lichenis]|uniref:histidine kinase n=1 Tax=Paracraurococcus lichenis TaxID=3064888 RepID=A0ABT9E9S5_9PROT|nr:PAS domain-containing sensor histidine kinase [Paracraurococcus sp. LOR1-02]MDO9712961.1 ATP-binding protein [Paracraurococcus sp. LOR1-02]